MIMLGKGTELPVIVIVKATGTLVSLYACVEPRSLAEVVS